LLTARTLGAVEIAIPKRMALDHLALVVGLERGAALVL